MEENLSFNNNYLIYDKRSKQDRKNRLRSLISDGGDP
jgi:hypothetical protein